MVLLLINFDRQLEIGMSGADVSALQAFLARDKTIYPQGLITGYFGFLTQAAVSNFQSRNSLPPVGRVGPLTLPVLNQQSATEINVSEASVNNIVSAPVTNTVNPTQIATPTDTTNLVVMLVPLLSGGVVQTGTSLTIAAGETRLFTIRASVATNIQADIGKQLIIDVTSIDAVAPIKGSFPIRGTTWTIN